MTRIHVLTKTNHQTRQVTHYHVERKAIREIMGELFLINEEASCLEDKVRAKDEQIARLEAMVVNLTTPSAPKHTKDECITLTDAYGYCPHCEAITMLGEP